jgi:hypothetical protein
VSLAAAQREVMDRFHEELRVGITMQVSSGALATAQTIAKAVDRIGTGRGGGESITNAFAIAQIAGTGTRELP